MTLSPDEKLEAEIDEVLVDMTNVCNDCEHPKCLAQLKAARKRIMRLIKSREERLVREAKNSVIEWLEADLKRLDSRNWGIDTLALDLIVSEGKADDYQKSKRQQIVEDRRAAHALYAILENYKKRGNTDTALKEGE